MRLSVLLPSHRAGLSACSRILEACSWACEDIEVIVRDNSGCALKRSILSEVGALAEIRPEYCRILFVDECDDYENGMALLQAARGDFVFFAADDDLCGRRSIDAMLSLINQYDKDESVVGVTGHYICEIEGGTQLVKYRNVDSPSALERVNGYLAAGTANVILWSARRRTTWLALGNFIMSLPFRFSYLDQIVVVMALLSGRYVDINRLIYAYEGAGWDGVLRFERDYSYYKASGIDRSVLWLHWLFCGFEGARVILSDLVGGSITVGERLLAASTWYNTMLARLQGYMPHEPQTPFDRLAVQLRSKWLETPNVDLNLLLADLSEFLLVVIEDKTKAIAFREYWSAIRFASS